MMCENSVPSFRCVAVGTLPSTYDVNTESMGWNRYRKELETRRQSRTSRLAAARRMDEVPSSVSP